MSPPTLTLLNPPLFSATLGQRWAARGDRIVLPVKGRVETLLHLFDMTHAPTRDPPVAALTRLVDHPADAPTGYWLRADPVHLRADRDRVWLFAGAALDIFPQEATTLSAALTAHFQAQGWRCDAPHPERWYLHLPDDPGLRCHDLPDVVGRSIGDYLPRPLTPAAQHWATWLTEAQMLLHHHPVNSARAARGAPAVNALWLWGGGVLPPAPIARWAQVWSDDALCAGLCKLTDTPHGPASRMVVSNLMPGATLLVSDEDISLPPLQAALQRGHLSALTILDAQGYAYRNTRRTLWRFWRRHESPQEAGRG